MLASQMIRNFRSKTSDPEAHTAWSELIEVPPFEATSGTLLKTSHVYGLNQISRQSLRTRRSSAGNVSYQFFDSSFTSENVKRRRRSLGDLPTYTTLHAEASSSIDCVPHAHSIQSSIVYFASDRHIVAELYSGAANIAMDQYHRSHRATPLRVAIRHCRAALSCASLHPNVHAYAKRLLATALRELGHLLSQKHQHEIDLRQAIVLLQEAAHLRLDSVDEQGEILQKIFDCFKLCHETFGLPADLDGMEETASRLVALLPQQDPRRARSLNNLGAAIHRGYYLCGHGLGRSLKCYTYAIVISKPGDVEYSRSLSNMALVMKDRYESDGNLSELDEAVRLGNHACELLSSEHPLQQNLLDNLAFSLLRRFRANNEINDLQKAISVIRHVLLIRHEHNPLRARTLRSLASALRDQFLSCGNLEDVEEALNLLDSAAQLSQDTFAERQEITRMKAHLLSDRFSMTGNESDIEVCMQLRRAIIHNPSAVHSLIRSATVVDLIDSLMKRYEYIGSSDDLEEAIDLGRAALHQSSGSDTAYALIYLGKALVIYSDVQSCLESLHESISLFRRATDIPSRTFDAETFARSGAAAALLLRYKRNAVATDLQNAVHLSTAAVSMCSDGHHFKSDMLLEHSEVMLESYRAHRTPECLTIAFSASHEALSLRPPGHPRRSEVLYTQCRVHLMSSNAWEKALECCLLATNDISSGARLRLQGATEALPMLDRHDQDVPGKDLLLLEVYVASVSIIPEVSVLGNNLREQIAVVRGAESMTTDAVVCAVRCHRSATALELLELGRAVFWSQALRLRTSFDDLPYAIKAELRSLSRSIDIGMLSTQSVADNIQSFNEAKNRSHRENRTRVDELLANVRKLPGFERFLLPPLINSLAGAARDGYVVSLIASKSACFALALDKTGEVHHIPLLFASFEELRRIAAQFQDTMERLLRGRRRRNHATQTDWSGVYTDTIRRSQEVLQLLWEKVVSVILSSLKIPPSIGRSRPRLWWCLTGAFTFLPIHAAGIHNADARTGECCSDYVVSSYTPTLSALLKGKQCHTPILREDIKVLLAAVPIAFEEDWPDLPGTRQEVNALKQIIPGHMHTICNLHTEEGLDAVGATISTIEENIHSATILHLSSHGWQNPDDPLGSGFVMRDGLLTVDRLMKLSLPNAFLAYLSACDTAKGDRVQPDQVIHLAAAMLFTGFRSVVGTMWSIEEDDGIFVATEFYKRMLAAGKETLEADDVAYALDEAVAMLRRRHNHPCRWASYVHLGV